MKEFKVQGVRCGGCAGKIVAAIRVIDPEARVEVDIAAARARIASSETSARLAETITAAGYPASPVED